MDKNRVTKSVSVEIGCQTDCKNPELVMKSESSQTPSLHSRNVLVETDVVVLVSCGVQTDGNVSFSKLCIDLPSTPSTVECNLDLLQRSNLSPSSELRSPKVAEAEERAFDTDMDTFLKSAMVHVLSPQNREPVDPAWFTETMDRYSSMDTSTVVGGEIYRTVSDPTDYDDSNEILANLDSILETHVRSKNTAAITLTVNRMARALLAELPNEEKIALIPFGSLASGLFTTNSSVDLAVLIPPAMLESLFGAHSVGSSSDIPVNQMKEYEMRLMMRKALQKIGEILTEKCALTVVKLTNVGSVCAISTSKIPTLSMVDLECGLRFEITCNNLFPLFSTRLVKTYVKANKELGDLIMLVKYWAGKRKTGLSGFAWTLLCIFYCQTQLQVIPSLQGSCSERKQWKDPFGSRRCDVSFVESLESVNWGGLTGGSLFVGFFDFFAHYWNWNSGVVSVRLGRTVNIDSSEVLLKQGSNGFNNNQRMYIEDPFDSKKDLAALIQAETLFNEITTTSWALSGTSPNLLGELFETLKGTLRKEADAFTPLRRTVTSISESFAEPTYRRSESCQ